MIGLLLGLGDDETDGLTAEFYVGILKDAKRLAGDRFDRGSFL